MSWVEVPDGVKMPSTTTYERAIKRQRSNFRSYSEGSRSADTPRMKYEQAMSDYSRETKRIARVNKFRTKRGLRPLSSPARPKKASFGLKGG